MDYLVVRMPTEYESNSGFVYMNRDDMKSEFVQIGDLVYRCLPHSAVKHRTIAMNWVQRRQARTSHVFVLEWNPTKNIDIQDLGIDVHWVVIDKTTELPSIEMPFKTHFKNHILSPGQEVLLYVGYNIAECKIKMNSRGMMTHNTHLQVL
jgi:hypothetical protein